MKITQVIIGAVVAFASTFSGVFLAFYLHQKSVDAEEKETFNSMFRVMAYNCRQALDFVKENRPIAAPTPLTSPSFLLSNVHQNSTTLNNVDEERMKLLVGSITRTLDIVGQYTVKAMRFDRWRAVLTPPPNNASPEYKQEFKNAQKAKQNELDEIKNLYNEYEDQLENTCDVFFETVQK